MNLLKIAWRNLWRNKTRTLLTVFVVFFVVILATIMSSQQYGQYDYMINNIVESTGHLQIQDTNFIKNKTLNDAFVFHKSLIDSILVISHVIAVSPRIESFSLASNADKTKGVLILGIDPEREKYISNFDSKLARYRFSFDSTKFNQVISSKLKIFDGKSFNSAEVLDKRFKSILGNDYTEDIVKSIASASKFDSDFLKKGDKGVVIGEALAKFLNLSIDDTLVLISQGYHGVSAQGLFAVRGYIKLPLSEMERRFVLMDINACQEFYSAPDMATSISIKVDGNSNLRKVNSSLNNIVPANLRSKTWEELQPETVQMIESDKAGGVFMKGIFYMIVGFILFGTIMMVMSERRHEFGIVIAIGMQRTKLAIIILIETLMISFIGTISGLLLSFPIVNILHKNPIPLSGEMAQIMEEFGFDPVIYFSNASNIFFTQALIIFIVSLIIFVLPLMSIGKLNVINSIHR